MGYADSFEVPVVIEFEGKQLALAPLTQRDYLPWLDDLSTIIRERDRAAVAAMKIKDAERFDMNRRVELSEAIPDDLEPQIVTARGTIRVIELAIAKALKASGQNGDGTAERIQAFIDANSTIDNRALAIRVSGICSRRRIAFLLGLLLPEDKPKDQPSPPQPGQSGV